MRRKSFGQNWKLTFIDRLGVYLSNKKIISIVQKRRPKKIVDLGCGFHATLLQNLKNYSQDLVAVDLSLDKSINGIKLIEKRIDKDLGFLQTNTVDMLIMNNVLEHLEHPNEILHEIYRVLTNRGVAVVNVPTWLGKKFLEFSAFKLHLSPATEMNDHKMYYDEKDLWPLLVKAGFIPEKLTIKYHKFGLNLITYAEK